MGSPGRPWGSPGVSWTLRGSPGDLLGSPELPWATVLSWGLLASPGALQAGWAGRRRQEVGRRGASPWDTGMVAAEPPPKDGVARAVENAAPVALSHPESP